MPLVLNYCLLMQLTKMMEMKIHTAYKNCTPILAHYFNSCVTEYFEVFSISYTKIGK
jgi:hypothetical protein